MRRAIVAVLLAVSPACQPAAAPEPPLTLRTRWHTAERPPQTTSLAVVFFPGDAPKIDALDAKYLGRVIVRGTGSEAAFSQRASAFAPLHGGTHVVLVDESDTERTVTGGAKTTTSCFSATCVSTTSPAQSFTETKKTRVFAVFAVAPERWSELSPLLRPAPHEPAKPAPKQ